VISHVVWDWNGTLLNDNDAVLAAVNAVCADFGRAGLTWAEWQAVYARPMRVSYQQILDRLLDDDEWTRVDKLFHDRYHALLHTCDLVAGVRAELQRCADSGRTQSLLSMWFHARLVPTIEQFGLTGFFSRIDGIAGDVGGGSKSESLVRHLEAQDLDPADVVLIGDVVDDALAAQAAGTECILVTTGAMTRPALEATGVPVTNSVQEALHLLDT
jgi:phosphoglycolate phosphatase-like HAD superfamily hydrolase